MSSEFIDSLMDILESWGGSWVVEQGREAGWGVAAVYPVCRMVLLFWSIAAAYLPACYRLSSIVTFLPTKSSITVGLAFAGHSNLISCHAVHGPSLVWACSASSPAETISWIRHGSIFLLLLLIHWGSTYVLRPSGSISEVSCWASICWNCLAFIVAFHMPLNESGMNLNHNVIHRTMCLCTCHLSSEWGVIQSPHRWWLSLLWTPKDLV